MRFLHVSDLHIGKRVNGFSLVEDQRYILDEILRMCVDNAVDALVIAGDIYDKAAPSAEAVTVFDAFLTELAAQGVTVLAVPGNHDSAERISYVQSLLASQGVHFPPVYDGEIQKVELEDESGPVMLWLMPFLKPGDVRRFFPEADIKDDYTAALEAALSVCAIDTAQRNVVVSHQFVTAGGAQTERAEEEIKLGGLDNVDVSVYDAFDYVALGHVHRPQRIGRDTARYAGSPLKYSFSEARYAKSAVLVDVGPKGAGDEVGACVSFELLPLEPLRDMREVKGPLEAIVAAAQADPEGSQDYMRVILTDEFEQLDAVQKVRTAYPNMMLVEHWTEAKQSAEEREVPVVNPDEIDMLELFAQFFEEQAERPMDEEQAALVAKLVNEVEDGLARGEAAGKEGAR